MLPFLMTLLTLCLSPAHAQSPLFYSPFGKERIVSFSAIYRTQFKSLEELNSVLPNDRSNYINYSIIPTLKYLFGPMTRRSLGGIRKMLALQVNWTQASETPRGVEVPFDYKALWLVDEKLLANEPLAVPLPFNTSTVFSAQWQRCTDRQHNSSSFYWYYWDPERPSCDQVLDVNYQSVLVKLSDATIATKETYPEYQNMIHLENGKATMALTFAFGYFEEPANPQPETDHDVGAMEFQSFLKDLKKQIPAATKVSEIISNEYLNTNDRVRSIGKRFQFTKAGTQYDIKVIMNAGVDQIYLFAKSFATDHDAFFAWLGHSRVGSGFDAERIKQIIREHPNTFSITDQYQLIFWGGCNSYSYYSDPFFKMKAGLSPNDPNGTKFLDIIANGLPSYFGLNAANALIQLKAMLNWKTPTSYQTLLQEMERTNIYKDQHFLSVVLGDEDNAPINHLNLISDPQVGLQKIR